MNSDFTVSGGGSIFLLTPHTPAAEEWVVDNLPGELTRLGNGIAVEPRYLDDIIEGIQGDGLEVG